MERTIESSNEAMIGAGRQFQTDRIIAGRFGTKAQADVIAQQILLYVDDHDLSIFHNNPPGQHGLSVFGHDDEIARIDCLPSGDIRMPTAYVDHAQPVATQNENNENTENTENAENTEHAEKVGVQSAAATAAVAGVVIGATALAAGPIVALAAAGVAAYTGSLAGALGGMGDGKDSQSTHAPTERHGGIILAVHITHPTNEFRVIQDLEKAGAADIEWADGHWRDGDWADFNPKAFPNLVKPIEHRGEK